MRFDAEAGRFYKADGTELPIEVTVKRGRYYYRMSDGRLTAAGISPATFAREFWLTELTEG